MTEPVRIAFGITDLDVGGAERTLVELVKRLDHRRWAAEVVCLQPEAALATELRNAGIPTTALNVRSFRDLPAAYRQWRQLLRSQQPVLLQTFLYHANLLGRFVGRSTGVPVVVSGIRVAERRSRLRLLLDRWTDGKVACHVCVSEGVRRFSVQHGLPGEKCVVIPNAVDVQRLQAANPVSKDQLTDDPNRVILLFVGRLDPQKGLFDLLQALIRVKTSSPTWWEKLQLVLIGDGPLRAELEQFCRANSLEPHVRFVGRQSNVPAWLAAADGLILPSHWEGMPNAVLEAMAASLPVIGTQVEGTEELVIPGETGWLVPPHQPLALAETILQWISDPQKRTQFGQRGRALVLEKYSYDKMVSHYEQLYLRLLAANDLTKHLIPPMPERECE